MNTYNLRKNTNSGHWEVAHVNRRLGPTAMQELLDWYYSQSDSDKFNSDFRFIVETREHRGYEYLHISSISYAQEPRSVCEYYAGFYSVIGFAVADEETARLGRDILERRLVWQILKNSRETAIGEAMWL